jgi:hypothetical protein
LISEKTKKSQTQKKKEKKSQVKKGKSSQTRLTFDCSVGLALAIP